jgi:hypothetical protein
MSAPDLSGITGNYFVAVQKGFSDSLNGSILNNSTTITLNSVAGFSNGQSVFLWIDPGASTAELVYGIVATATNQLTSCVRGVLGSAAAHSNGATVSQYVSSADIMSMRKGILVEHNQDGTHNTSFVVTPSATQTLTNKKIQKRVGSVTSGATITPTSDTVDEYNVTALAVGATIAAPSGTPADGQILVLRIKDNGTSRTLSFNAIYRFSSDLPAPSATTVNKTMYLGFIYNAADGKWDNVSQLNNF